MAMAMANLQLSSLSTLLSSSRIASSFRFYEEACMGTSSNFSSGRRASCKSLLRATPRLSTQRTPDSVQFCGGHGVGCGSESAADLITLERQWSQALAVVDSESSRWRGRRECLLAVAMGGVLVSQDYARAEETQPVVAVDTPNLELYVDEKEGFKLLRPALWTKVEKAGATVLFEDPAKRGNTIGVVVNPVRIASLKDFGTPDVVADKLIAAERKKPSTNDAQLVRVQERQAHGDTPLYALEYTLDSSRGQKRILSAVTVASKKLYILNITYVDSAATPAPPAMAEAFEQVLNSFDLLI